jgi:hypothetical protein
MLFSLNSAELAAFADELSAVVRAWAQRAQGNANQTDDAPDSDRSLVYFLAHAFPLRPGADD